MTQHPPLGLWHRKLQGWWLWSNTFVPHTYSSIYDIWQCSTFVLIWHDSVVARRTPHEVAFRTMQTIHLFWKMWFFEGALFSISGQNARSKDLLHQNCCHFAVAMCDLKKAGFIWVQTCELTIVSMMGLLFQTFSPAARCSLGVETSDPKILDFQTARWHWTNLRDFLNSHHFRISPPDGTIWECTHTPKAPFVIILHRHYCYPLQWTIPNCGVCVCYFNQ